MRYVFLRSIAAALLLGGAIAAGTSIVGSTLAYAAALKTENKALADAINGMTADYKAGKYREALERAKTADGIAGKPATLTAQVHQMIIAAAVAARDYPAALAQLDKMLAAGEGDKRKNLGMAVSIAFQSGNQGKAMGYVNELGSDLNPETRLYIAQGYAKAKKYKEALEEVAPLRQGEQSEALLLFLQDIYNDMGDSANRRATLELLVADHPKPQYWHDLLQLARNERGLSDEQSMDIQRLRLAVGDMKTETDYQEAAQLALVAEYPNEAKGILDKANAAKVLSGERADRLVKLTNDRVSQDTAKLTELQKKAAVDPNAAVKLGIVYWTYGKYKDAEEAIRSGMKGKLADPDGAKVALGHALLGEGKKADAVAAFNSVPKNSKEAPIARLWSIYARRA